MPPDYFSATGQRWGNPLYDWEKMAAAGYRFKDFVRVGVPLLVIMWAMLTYLLAQRYGML